MSASLVAAVVGAAVLLGCLIGFVLARGGFRHSRGTVNVSHIHVRGMDDDAARQFAKDVERSVNDLRRRGAL